MKRIEIIVSQTGTTQIETKGFAGDGCREASRFLEVALGCKTAETLTAEFHQQTATQQDHLEQRR